MTVSKTPLQWFSTTLGFPQEKTPRVFWWNTLAASWGYGCYASALALFSVTVLGIPALETGVALSAATITGAILSPLAGRLCDLIGGKKIAVTTSTIQSSCFASIALLPGHHYSIFLSIMIILGIAEAAGNTARGAMIPFIVADDQRTQLSASLRTSTNLGFGAATLVVGLLLMTGSSGSLLRLLVAVNSPVCLVIAFRLALTVPDARWKGDRIPWKLDVPFMLFAITSSVVAWLTPMMTLGIPAMIAADTQLYPKALVSFALLVNSTVVILLQVRVSQSVNHWTNMPRVSLAAFTILSISVFPMMSIKSVQYMWIRVVLTLLIVAIWAVSEVITETVRWEARYRWAHSSQQGNYAGLYTLANTAAGGLGPLMIGLSVGRSIQLGWAVLGGVALILGMCATFVLARFHPVYSQNRGSLE